MSGEVFPHGFDNSKDLATSWTGSSSTDGTGPCLALRWATSACLVVYPLITLPAPVPLLLPTGFQMKVPHGSEGENLAATAKRSARFPGVCFHMML